MNTVLFEAIGDVAVVTINRPEIRNAVDGPTAALLADAFRRFDADDHLSVAVLTGAGGTFCAGADLKAISSGQGNRVDPAAQVDGPMGPTRLLLTKPVIAAVEGLPLRAAPSWPSGAISGSPRRTPPSGCTAGAGVCRSSTGARCDSRA
ncbi:MAG: paaG [Ilumatobacteraceae bacterium]|nr:paaG [Ilumatobacteraceae bacterium]